MATYRNVEFKMVRGGRYFYILSRYKGVDFKIPISDLDTWFFIDDESYKEKHMEALRYCYMVIKEAYKNRK